MKMPLLRLLVLVSGLASAADDVPMSDSQIEAAAANECADDCADARATCRSKAKGAELLGCEQVIEVCLNQCPRLLHRYVFRAILNEAKRRAALDGLNKK